MIQNESHQKHLEGEGEEDTRHNRVIGKVKKTQHLNPEFCHTEGEIFQKNLLKKVH
jgi:hypothetical protein